MSMFSIRNRLQLESCTNGRHDSHSAPTCIHCDLEWRVTAYDKIIAKGNEIYDKTPQNEVSERGDCSVTVSVNDRAEDDLIKCYSNHKID